MALVTPEALSQYLLSHGLDSDAVQDTLVTYMTWQGPPIRHPKAWAWRHVYWKTRDEHRKRSIRGKGTELPPNLVSTAPNPLTQAEQRQRIERFAQQMKGVRRWSLWAQRNV